MSGGEAQRIKLAKELSKRQTGRTFYLLDEPTTGLHFDDVRHLLEVLQRLVDLGNTVLVIEHHLDVIRNADYVIDLGPEGGEEGGSMVAAGTPEEVMENRHSHTGPGFAPDAKRGQAGLNDPRKMDTEFPPATETPPVRPREPFWDYVDLLLVGGLCVASALINYLDGRRSRDHPPGVPQGSNASRHCPCKSFSTD